MSWPWFRALFGVDEPASYSAARDLFELSGEGDALVLVSKPNDARFHLGKFETPSVSELRARLAEGVAPASTELSASAGGSGGSTADSSASALDAAALGGLQFENLSGDVRALHSAKECNGAVFQVPLCSDR